MKSKITISFMVGIIALSTATLAQDAPKIDDFKPSGKLSGQIFGDYEVKVHSDSLMRGSTQYAKAPYTTHFNSFDFRRVYLGYDYNFTERFTAQLLLSHEGNNFDQENNRSFLLKLANIRWKEFFTGTDLVVGAMATNAFPLLSEQIYGYRSVEKTITDMRGIESSSDFGVALQGRFMKGKEYGYNILVANNSKYSPETNSYKKVYVDVWAKFLDKKIVIDLFGDYERQSQPHPLELSKTTLKVFIAYQTDPITIGVEAFQQTAMNYTHYQPEADSSQKIYNNAMPFGLSVFAHAPLMKTKLGAFVRFDTFDPDTKYSSGDVYLAGSVNGHLKETFLTAGLDWTPTRNVHFMPNVWLDTYSDQANNVSGKVKSDYDLDIRYTFFWKF